MTKISLSVLLLCSYSTASSMEPFIDLPSKKEINNRLSSLDLAHFVKTTQLDETLAFEQRHIIGIVSIIDSALDSYQPKNEDLAIKAKTQRPHIIKAIVQNPEALKYLKKRGALHASV